MEFPNTHYVPIDQQNKDSFQIFFTSNAWNMKPSYMKDQRSNSCKNVLMDL